MEQEQGKLNLEATELTFLSSCRCSHAKLWLKAQLGLGYSTHKYILYGVCASTQGPTH